jgi:hypothetical protein
VISRMLTPAKYNRFNLVRFSTDSRLGISAPLS